MCLTGCGCLSSKLPSEAGASSAMLCSDQMSAVTVVVGTSFQMVFVRGAAGQLAFANW